MTRRRRWSDHLEGQRGGAELAARESAARIEQIEAKAAAARAVLLNNPDLALGYLAEILTLAAQAHTRQERIIRLMIEAEHGLNP